MNKNIPENLQSANCPQDLSDQSFLNRLFMFICAVTLSALVLFILFYATEVFLLLFAAILFSIFLQGLAGWIHERTRFSFRSSITLVMLIFFLFLTALISNFSPLVSEQIRLLSEKLPPAFENVLERLQRVELIGLLLESDFADYLMPSPRVLIGKTGSLATSMLGGLGQMLLVVILGFYLSLHSHVYINGFLRLIPPSKRQRSKDIMLEIAHKLRAWLIGRFAGMMIITVLTTVGLIVLDVPLAHILGLTAGFLNFIPNIGPILALLPAVVIGFAQNEQTALYVFFLYLGVQFIETYILTPWIERQTVSLPPAFVIFAQILLGLLLGFLGLALATPLSVVLVVLLQRLYVEDVLGDKEAG